jgi:hypothetical protein
MRALSTRGASSRLGATISIPLNSRRLLIETRHRGLRKVLAMELTVGPSPTIQRQEITSRSRYASQIAVTTCHRARLLAYAAPDCPARSLAIDNLVMLFDMLRQSLVARGDPAQHLPGARIVHALSASQYLFGARSQVGGEQ